MAMMQHLKRAGIGTGIHYPVPLHLQKAYESLQVQYVETFRWPIRVAAEIVSLPMFPQLTAGQQARWPRKFLASLHPLSARYIENLTPRTVLGLLASPDS